MRLKHIYISFSVKIKMLKVTFLSHFDNYLIGACCNIRLVLMWSQVGNSHLLSVSLVSLSISMSARVSLPFSVIVVSISTSALVQMW